MSSVIYAIVFKGEITEGSELTSVKSHMAKLLKADADKIARLFSGKQVVIKKTTDKQLAIKYGTVLKKAGADVKIKVVKRPQGESQASSVNKKKQPQQSTATVGGFELKANQGNIFDPLAEKKAPPIDLGAYSLTENDGSLLIEPTIVEKVELDLSEYEISKNDGSLLIEPSPEVPKVNAPDFGLDEPGALLEMLKDDKPPVNPDISGIKLAAQDGNLIEIDELHKAPPPKPPDTSKIKLKPDF